MEGEGRGGDEEDEAGGAWHLVPPLAAAARQHHTRPHAAAPDSHRVSHARFPSG